MALGIHGLDSDNHGVFLGGMKNCDEPQIFEELERQGLTVGCISHDAVNAFPDRPFIPIHGRTLNLTTVSGRGLFMTSFVKW